MVGGPSSLPSHPLQVKREREKGEGKGGGEGGNPDACRLRIERKSAGGKGSLFFYISCRSFSESEFANVDRKKYVACSTVYDCVFLGNGARRRPLHLFSPPRVSAINLAGGKSGIGAAV